MGTAQQRAEAIDRLARRHRREMVRMVSMSDAAGVQAATNLERLLIEAERQLRRKLLREAARRGGRTARFTEASHAAYLAQVREATAYVSGSLRGILQRSAARAAQRAAVSNRSLLRALDGAYEGVVRPLRLNLVDVLQTEPTLLLQHATSVDRYGTAMIGRMQEQMSLGMLQGESQYEIVQRLVSDRGPRGVVSLEAVEVQPGLVVRIREADIPEGLFRRHRHWAWRIVRTETANAAGLSTQRNLESWRASDFPDLKKKILAILDGRVALDSLGVHGQVKELHEPFIDGVGRVYMHPPARPHDRETVIPWRDRWDATPSTRGATQGQIEAAASLAERRREMPRRAAARVRQDRQRQREDRAQARREG